MIVKETFAIPQRGPLRFGSNAGTWPEAACFVVLVALLILGPLWFGAVTPTPVFILRSGAAVLAVVWAVTQAERGELRARLSSMLVPALAFAAIVAIQLVAGLTVYAQTTKEHGLDLVTAILLMFVAMQVVREQERALQFGWVMVAFAGLLALFSEVQYISGTTNVYWSFSSRYPTWIFGPYFDHNHFAGLMEMLLPIALVWSTARWVSFDKKLLAAVAVLLVVTSVLLSGSRAGLLIVLAQLVAFGLLYSRHRSWHHMFAASLAALVVIAGVGAYLGSHSTWVRAGTLLAPTGQDMDLKGRMRVVPESWPAIKMKPVLGWGLGTFPIVFPQFQSAQTDVFMNEAHDEYVQIAVEAGMAGLAVAIWFLVLLFRDGARVTPLWNSTPLAGLGTAAWLGCAGIVLHSFVDFNLHIPANAAMFAVLTGIVGTSAWTAASK